MRTDTNTTKVPYSSLNARREAGVLVESGEWTLAEARRLQFARWLVRAGRLNEAAP